jgi:hypothetical protein
VYKLRRVWAPVSGRMVGNVRESLRSEAAVVLKENGAATPIYEGTGTTAGFEIHGEVQGFKPVWAG